MASPEDGWTRAWELAVTLRRRGITPTAADCFIATVAIAHQVRLIHCEADFEGITAHSDLQTVDWTGFIRERQARS